MKESLENKKEIMNRNEKGKVKVDGISFKVPKNVSALSILGMNKPVDNSEFKKDGWVYFNNKPIKKWFITHEGIRIWEPILNDLAKLEQRYWNMCIKLDKFTNEVYKPIANKLVKVKQAHAKITHKHDGDSNFWLYTAGNDGNYGWGISFDWVDNKPKKLKNIKIGQEYYKVSERHMEICKRVGKFRSVLNRAIEHNLWTTYKPTVKDVGATIQLNINGRLYWYVCAFHGSVAVWNKVSWASENSVRIVEIK